MPRYIDADALLEHYIALENIGWKQKVAPPSWSYAYKSFIDYILELPATDGVPRSEWISVEDRLPGKSGTYLTYVNDHFVALDYSKRDKLFNASDDLPEEFNRDTKIAVTHWMPLPEPPEMKEGE